MLSGTAIDRHGTRQQPLPLRGQSQSARPPVVGIREAFDQAAPFQRLQRRRQGRPVHGEKRCHRAHIGRYRAVERHQQRELSVGDIERAQPLVEPAGKGARGTLHMQAEAGVLHMQGGIERNERHF